MNSINTRIDNLLKDVQSVKLSSVAQVQVRQNAT